MNFKIHDLCISELKKKPIDTQRNGKKRANTVPNYKFRILERW